MEETSIKHREIVFDSNHPDPQQGKTAALRLSDVPGVLDVQVISDTAIKVSYHLLEIDLQQTQVQVDGDTARVLATGSGLGSRTGQQGEFLEIHSGVITLVREHGEWLITGATHLRDERQPER